MSDGSMTVKSHSGIRGPRTRATVCVCDGWFRRVCDDVFIMHCVCPGVYVFIAR